MSTTNLNEFNPLAATRYSVDPEQLKIFEKIANDPQALNTFANRFDWTNMQTLIPFTLALMNDHQSLAAKLFATDHMISQIAINYRNNYRNNIYKSFSSECKNFVLTLNAEEKTNILLANGAIWGLNYIDNIQTKPDQTVKRIMDSLNPEQQKTVINVESNQEYLKAAGVDINALLAGEQPTEEPASSAPA